MQKSITIGFRVSPAEAERLAELARRSERTPSAVLRRLLAQATLKVETWPCRP
jgi:predicted transcriptional regulator